jgi:hypothetical protein
MVGLPDEQPHETDQRGDGAGLVALPVREAGNVQASKASPEMTRALAGGGSLGALSQHRHAPYMASIDSTKAPV